jgi:hypothetical protein
MKDSTKNTSDVCRPANYLVKVLGKRQSMHLYLLVGLWLIVAIAFSVWWLQPAHYTGPIRFLFNSFILVWDLIMPGYYFYFLCRMKKPNPELEIPSSWRIAMVTTKAPSEPFSRVQKTLLAMKAQMPAHDTWFVDAAKCTFNKATLEWKITPKGSPDVPVIQLSMLVPYILIIAFSLVIILVHPRSSYTIGYLYLAVFSILTLKMQTSWAGKFGPWTNLSLNNER